MKRLLLVALFVLGIAGVAWAAVDLSVVLMTETSVTTTKTGTRVRMSELFTNGDLKPAGHYICHIKGTENSGSATIDGKIQHSRDCVQWTDLCTFTQLTSSGWEEVHVNHMTTGVYDCLRAIATVGGSGNWDVTISLDAFVSPSRLPAV